MKFTVRASGGLALIEKGMARIYRDDADGKTEDTGNAYQNTLLPGGSRTHRVFYDTKKREYIIGLSTKELSAIAKEMRLIDPKTDKLIESADPRNELDPFFIHDDLVLEVPNGGITLDDDTPEGKYWLAAIQTEPHLFDINNTTDNPLIKKNQDFRVTTAGHSEKEVAKDIKEGEKATGIYHAIKDDVQKLIDTCRAMDIIVDDSPDIEMMRTAIYTKITTEKDYKTRSGVRNIDKFLSLYEMKKEDFTFRALVGKAVGMKLITREKNNYVYENVILGNTQDKAFEFLSRKENAKLKEGILAQMEMSIA